jgi:hypothetical protein
MHESIKAQSNKICITCGSKGIDRADHDISENIPVLDRNVTSYAQPPPPCSNWLRHIPRHLTLHANLLHHICKEILPGFTEVECLKLMHGME